MIYNLEISFNHSITNKKSSYKNYNTPKKYYNNNKSKNQSIKLLIIRFKHNVNLRMSKIKSPRMDPSTMNYSHNYKIL